MDLVSTLKHSLRHANGDVTQGHKQFWELQKAYCLEC